VTDYFIIIKFIICTIMWSFVLADFWTWTSCRRSCLPLGYTNYYWR